ncbi:unnamed protein product [Phyllotreta striolata]|uniref:L-dopachrome isomerase n=1 Tax=Phyllotreta striolata TaxID=444603 RepID=A0A9N9XIN9_PHYSR|nr:unnamed protein product [Phyllotreta striolata]
MPHFHLETNLPQEQIPDDLPEKICSILASSLGKPKDYCAATIIGGAKMYFKGSSQPTAQATLMSIGSLGVAENKKHSKVLFEVIEKSLGIPSDRVYIHFMEAATKDVGHGGTTFHDILG